uniref:C3/C5 convertase n=1 Tax=Echeneis naucrates TaxID=173247 RepID=A0A665UIU2_ECHNA
MGFSVTWSWFGVLLVVLCMGEVWCDCTEEGMEIQGGNYFLTKQLRSGSVLVYNCSDNYFPYPHLTRTCQLDGTWRPPPLVYPPQKCKMVECPDPNVLEYGDVNPPQRKYYVGNVTTYECYSGYTLRGSGSRVCLSSGKWNGSFPICSRDSGDACLDPGIPPGASRKGNTFGIGDSVTYSCNGKWLFLVGSKERVCQENGQWTGRAPECYYKHTYDTAEEASAAFGSAMKDTLFTLETSNVTQAGKTIRISKGGILDIYIAVDISESIDEEEIKAATDAVISLVETISSFDVSPNYEIFLFSSEIIPIVNILDFLNGSIESCFTVCLDSTDYNTAGTNLKATFERFLDQMSFIQERTGAEAFKEHRHVIILFTDGAYNMGGSPDLTLQKIKNLVYMNHIDGSGPNPREEYLDIYVFAIGNEIFDDDLQALTVGVGGKHYFRMEAIEVLQSTFDEMIDEGDLKGLCGLHKADDLEDSKRKMYPWWAYVAVKQDTQTFKCLGSLVTPRYILTAAHCFKDNSVPDDVTVDLDDNTGDKGKKVVDIIIHDKYNIRGREDQGVKEFYDYDVALVQLERDIEISKQARPICIPCTEETNIALKLPRKAACSEQEKLLLKDRHELLHFLSKGKRELVEKDAHVKLGDARQSCIEHALEAENIITTKDPEVAVTENFLCSGGANIHHISSIACKGDSGGAVFKNYKRRTVQIAVVSWGSKFMCSGGGAKNSDANSRDFFINLFKVVPFLKSTIGNSADEGITSLTFLD